MREYELYVPLHYNDGRPIEPEKLVGLKRRLVDEFGGLTHFPQENEGYLETRSAYVPGPHCHLPCARDGLSKSGALLRQA